MYVINKKTLIKFTSLLGLLAALQVSPVSANPNETAACASHIQEKISWDNDGHAKWEQKNIEKLCKGTTSPKEPGECFKKVMSGHVKWGEGDKWEWENAVNLCSGTNDSEQTIECFKKQVHAGTAWKEAVTQCQAK